MSQIPIFETINFAVTIGLGVISLALGIFAIWLSRHFDSKSSSALGAIKDLASEIRSLTKVVLTLQKDFSTKMLDFILSPDQYGRIFKGNGSQASSGFEEVVRRALAETEQRIIETVTDKVRSIPISAKGDPKALEKALDEILNQIKLIAERATSAIASPVTLTPSVRVKATLQKWQRYPAHYVILAAILKENARSYSDLAKVRQKYNFPGKWEFGLGNLIDSSLVTGTKHEFETPIDYRAPLAAWIDRNWPVIAELIVHYRDRKKEGLTNREIELASLLEF